MSSTAPEALIERMRPILGRHPEIAAAWLFGSAAREELRPDSAIDVGLRLRDQTTKAADVHPMLGDLTAASKSSSLRARSMWCCSSIRDRSSRTRR